jgi:hypothetical protein
MLPTRLGTVLLKLSEININNQPLIICRFFTLAHEIAHNLVQPHNSEHEFYFSAICEKYVGALAQLLKQ